MLIKIIKPKFQMYLKDCKDQKVQKKGEKYAKHKNINLLII